MAIDYEKRDGVAYITLNNPAKANILDKPTSDAISEAWIDLWEDRDIRCAILTGAGDRHFCGGHNLAPRQNITEEEREYLRTQRIFWPLAGTVHGQKTGVDGRMGDHYPRVWKPVIAAVNGWAAGAGLYILLSSTDIRIASAEHARFKFALLTQGWLGHGPGASLLIKQLRYIDAMKILLTDEPFDAQEALRIGLVNEVVPHAQLLERAEKIARHIVTLPPVAVRMMKEFVVRFGDLPTDQAWHVQNLINSLLIQTTTDGEEGRQAFNEKRPPNFTGALRRRGEPGRNRRRKTRNGSTRPIAAASSKAVSDCPGPHSSLMGIATLNPSYGAPAAPRTHQTWMWSRLTGYCSRPPEARVRPPLPPLPELPLDEEHPFQPAFAKRLAEDAESEKRNEHQQHNDKAGDGFLQPRTDELAQRGSNRPVMEQADNGFLDNGHDDQQHQEGERLMQCRPDQRSGGVPPADLHCVTEQHEFCQDRGLDDGDAPRSKVDALGMQHRGLHQDHRAKRDVKVDDKDHELFELVNGALLQCRFCVGRDCQDSLLPQDEFPPVGQKAPFFIQRQPAVRNDEASAPSVANPSAIDESAPGFHGLGRSVAIPAANTRTRRDLVRMVRLGGMNRPRVLVIGCRSIGADAAGPVRGRSALGGICLLCRHEQEQSDDEAGHILPPIREIGTPDVGSTSYCEASFCRGNCLLPFSRTAEVVSPCTKYHTS